MNKTIKILLSVVIVSLSALAIPLKGYGENVITGPVTVIANTEKQTESIIDILSNESIITNSEIDSAIEEMNEKMSAIGAIQDKKEWFIAYKDIIEEYSYILDPLETIYDYFSEEELDLLFRVVEAEATEGNFIDKANIASVVFNRFRYDEFGNTLSEILVPSQFFSIKDRRCYEVTVTEDTILACEYVFLIESIVEDAIFFDSTNGRSWAYENKEKVIVEDTIGHDFFR